MRLLVLIVQDVHWAEPTFIEFVAYLTDSVDAPLLLLCLARPKFLEQRPVWKETRDNVETLVLDPLSRDQVEKLVNLHLTKHKPAYERAE